MDRRDFLTTLGAGAGLLALGAGCRDEVARPNIEAAPEPADPTAPMPTDPAATEPEDPTAAGESPAPADGERPAPTEANAQDPEDAMTIDLYHDTVCPWCRIGHVRLARALEAWEGGPVTIRYRPFLLEPDAPPEGHDLRERLAAKYGPDNIEGMFDRVTAIGREEGIDFRFDAIRLGPDSTLSHALVEHAPEDRKGPTLDAIHEAYFTRGEDIGDVEVLVRCAETAGLDGAAAREALTAPGVRDRIRAQVRAEAQTIRGVPHFVFGGTVTIQGAQPTEVLLDSMRRARL